MILHHRRATGFAAPLAATLALAVVPGCGASAGSAATPGTVDKVTYETAFGALGRDSYAWVAGAKGYFTGARLSVTVQPGAAGEVNLKGLESGAAQFAAVDFATAARAVGSHTYPNIRIVAAVQQRTVSSIVALASRHITSPGDLAGRKIGVAQGSILQPMFTGYARLAGFDPGSVRWVPAQPTQLTTMLLSGQVDAIVQYSLGVPSIEAAARCTGCVVVLPYDKYISDPYGSVIVTTTDTLRHRPDLVHRFVGALMRGLQTTIDDPVAAGQLLHQAYPQVDAVAAAAEVRLMAGYVTATTDAQPIGSMDQSRVARAIASLRAIGLYADTVAPDDLVAFDFTPHA